MRNWELAKNKFEELLKKEGYTFSKIKFEEPVRLEDYVDSDEYGYEYPITFTEDEKEASLNRCLISFTFSKTVSMDAHIIFSNNCIEFQSLGSTKAFDCGHLSFEERKTLWDMEEEKWENGHYDEVFFSVLNALETIGKEIEVEIINFNQYFQRYSRCEKLLLDRDYKTYNETQNQIWLWFASDTNCSIKYGLTKIISNAKFSNMLRFYTNINQFAKTLKETEPTVALHIPSYGHCSLVSKLNLYFKGYSGYLEIKIDEQNIYLQRVDFERNHLNEDKVSPEKKYLFLLKSFNANDVSETLTEIFNKISIEQDKKNITEAPKKYYHAFIKHFIHSNEIKNEIYEYLLMHYDYETIENILAKQLQEMHTETQRFGVVEQTMDYGFISFFKVGKFTFVSEYNEENEKFELFEDTNVAFERFKELLQEEYMKRLDIANSVVFSKIS